MLQGPQTCTESVISFDDVFLQPYCSFRIVCSVHMPQCVAFELTSDYFGVDCEKLQSSTITPPGPLCIIGGPEKAGIRHLKIIPGL